MKQDAAAGVLQERRRQESRAGTTSPGRSKKPGRMANTVSPASLAPGRGRKGGERLSDRASKEEGAREGGTARKQGRMRGRVTAGLLLQSPRCSRARDQ